MAQVTTLVCDMCKAVGADTYVFGQEQDWWEVDLCLKCQAPLVKWKAVGRETKRPTVPHRKFKKTVLPPQPGRKGP